MSCIIHVTLLKLLLHIQYPQLLPISLTILETKLQTSLEFVFFVLHTNGDIHCRQYLSQDSILGKMYCKQSGSGKVQWDWEKSGKNIYKEYGNEWMYSCWWTVTKNCRVKHFWVSMLKEFAVLLMLTHSLFILCRCQIFKDCIPVVEQANSVIHSQGRNQVYFFIADPNF